MNETLETLTIRVAEIESVGDSAIVLLQGLKSQLDAAVAAGDMTAVQDLSTRLGNQTQEIADAIALNTPAEPI